MKQLIDSIITIFTSFTKCFKQIHSISLATLLTTPFRDIDPGGRGYQLFLHRESQNSGHSVWNQLPFSQRAHHFPMPTQLIGNHLQDQNAPPPNPLHPLQSEDCFPKVLQEGRLPKSEISEHA